MSENNYTILQTTEVFHLEFLRWIGRKLKPAEYALKGGVNMRCFYKSARYSEDLDLDAAGISINVLRETVMKILKAPAFASSLKIYGIEEIVPPNITKAKQTGTTQRFKIHLITSSSEDLFTKIEFSRRGIMDGVAVQAVEENVLHDYKLPPLLVPHYDIFTAIAQKINALASRSIVQARDIFDLYILRPQSGPINRALPGTNKEKLAKAYENIFLISFEQFKDTVLAYLSEDEAAVYNNPAAWDEVKLRTAHFLEELKNE